MWRPWLWPSVRPPRPARSVPENRRPDGAAHQTHATCPDRRDGGGVSRRRTKIPEMGARRAAKPVVVIADCHMGERVDMGARVGSRETTRTYSRDRRRSRPPGLGARDSDALRRPVSQNLKRRMAREERHARKAIHRQGIERPCTRDFSDVKTLPIAGLCGLAELRRRHQCPFRLGLLKHRVIGFRAPLQGSPPSSRLASRNDQRPS